MTGNGARGRNGAGSQWDWRVWLAGLLSLLCIGLFALYSAILIGDHRAAAAGSDQPALDFAAIWTAARLAAEGAWRTIFDWPAFVAAQRLIQNEELPLHWFYPPPFLLVVLPLGLLGWPAAWLVFNLGSLALWSLAAWAAGLRFAGRRWLACATPSALVSTLIGQTSMLSAAVFTGWLHAFGQGRVVPAAALLACLTMKPQLGLLVPVALVAAGAWRMILWTAAFTLLLHGAATAVLGADYWPLYLDALGRRAAEAQGADAPNALSISPYGLLRFAELAHGTAIGAQIGASLFLAALVFAVWRGPAPYPLKAGLLLAAAPLTSPYAFFYEGLLVFAGAAWAARAGFGGSVVERTTLVLLWLGAVPCVILRLPFPVFYMPVLLAAVGLIALRALRPDTAAGP